jgi:GDP-mannose transporter
MSFILIILSSAIGAWSDVKDGPKFQNVGVFVSYSWMLFNCITTCSFTLLMKQKIKDVNFKDFDTVFYNNILSVPILIILSLISEGSEAYLVYEKYFLNTTDKSSNEFWGLMGGIFISSIFSFGISFSTAWAVRTSTSTTYRYIISLKAVWLVH